MGRVTGIDEHLRKLVEDAKPMTPQRTEGRPKITIVEGMLPEVCDQVEQAILQAPGQPTIFRRGASLVHVVPAAPATPRELARRPAGTPIIVNLDTPGLIDKATAAADFYRETRKGELRPSNCAPLVASALLARGGGRFPAITGTIEAPTLRTDGSLLQAPGYDAATGLLYLPGNAVFPPIEATPSREDGLQALEQLAEIVQEFPFESPSDKSVALAALLTALVRKSLGAAPFFGFSATTPGTGKTLLASAVAWLSRGRDPAVRSLSGDEAELKKTLFAAALVGDDPVLIDNIERTLSSDALCAFATSETISDRVLGVSRTETASTAFTLLLTGNNLQAGGDLASRVLLCRMDARCAHPEDRQFAQTDLRAWVIANRPRLVVAGLTFLLAYRAAKDKPQVSPWRFTEWNTAIRAPLLWAGYPDPLDTLRQSEDNDPRRIEHAAVMAAWHAEFGNKPTAVRDVIRVAGDRGLTADFALRDALADVCAERGELSLRRLGRWLGRVAGRIQAGLRVEKAGIRDGYQLWCVVALQQEQAQGEAA